MTSKVVRAYLISMSRTAIHNEMRVITSRRWLFNRLDGYSSQEHAKESMD